MPLFDWYNAILAFFEHQSALANLISIATPIILFGGWIQRDFIRGVGDPSLVAVAKWIDRHIGEASHTLNNSAVASFRIAIIDDQPDDFPVEYLRSLGYQIACFSQFPIANAGALETFDLLILDIAGVVPEDMRRGGLQLIKIAKALPYPPVVVAVSGKTYDPTVTEFFRLAEAQLKKPLGKLEFEEMIRTLLSSVRSPHALAEQIDALIGQVETTARARRSLTRRVIRSVTGHLTPHLVATQLAGPGRSTLEHLVEQLRGVCAFYEIN